jgi:hypothetical protein
MDQKNGELGGILITASDWKKIRELEVQARELFAEATENVWAFKRALSDDVSRLVRTGDGIRLAVIAGAAVGTLHMLALLLSSRSPPSGSGESRGDLVRGWRSEP